jgi:MFS family permease
VYHGWRVVSVCFVAAVFTWGLGVFGASVYLSEVVNVQGWSVAVVSGAVTGFYLTNALTLPVVGGVISRWGARPAIVGGSVLLAVGVALVGQVREPWQLYAAFICMGLGYAGMSVTSLSAAVAPWFERQQGRSIALALTGASFGAMVVVPVLVLSIGAFGFARATLGAAIIVSVVVLPLAWVVLRWRGPQALGLLPDGDGVAAGAGADTVSRAPWSVSRQAALRTWALWSTALGFAIALVMQVGFLTHHVSLAAPMLGATGAGWLVGATGMAALLGRLVLARVADGVDLRLYTAGLLLVQTCSLGSMAWLGGASALVIASLIYGFCLGQITTLSPIIVRREFGPASFAAIYAVAGMAIQLCSAFGPALYGLGRDVFGSYDPVLAVAGAGEFIALLVIVSGRAAR